MGTARDSDETRRRAISAAGPLFADRGFDGVSIRDIVAAAGTHLSAINYHFRDKEGLYRAVLDEVCHSPAMQARLAERPRADSSDPRSAPQPGVSRRPSGSAAAPGPETQAARRATPDPEAELVALMEAILADDAGKGADAGWQRRLAAREAMSPSPTFKRMVAGLFGPLFARVRQLLAAAGEADEAEPVVELQALVLLATIDSTINYAELLAQLTPALTKRVADTGWYARSLVAGAVAAVRAARPDQDAVERTSAPTKSALARRRGGSPA